MDYPAPGDPDLAHEVVEVVRHAFTAAHVPWAWPTGEHHRDYRVAADARPPHPPAVPGGIAAAGGDPRRRHSM